MEWQDLPAQVTWVRDGRLVAGGPQHMRSTRVHVAGAVCPVPGAHLSPRVFPLASQVVGSFLPPSSVLTARLACRTWRAAFAPCVQRIRVPTAGAGNNEGGRRLLIGGKGRTQPMHLGMYSS